MPPADLSTIEAHLRLAARNYNDARRRELEREVSKRELEGLLHRFDCALPMNTDRVIDGRAAFSQPVLAELRRRCTGDLARLARHARAADPRYDINRHMAIKRLARWLTGVGPWYEPSIEPSHRPKHRRRKPRPPVEKCATTTRECSRSRP